MNKRVTENTIGNLFTLRKKTVLIIGVTLVFLIMILYFTSSAIMMSGFLQVEQQDTIKNVNRAVNALSDDLSALNGFVGDWASWDETYSFIEDANMDYVDRNIPNTTFSDIRVNLMLYINSSGVIVFGRSFDLENGTILPVTESLQEHLTVGSMLLNHTDRYGAVKGIVLLPEGPMIVVSRPILDTERKAPIRGSTIWGRYLNAAEIERLAEITDLSLTVRVYSDSTLPADFRAGRDSISGDKPILVQPLGEQSIAGYTILRDIYGKPALLLRAEMPRAIYNQGRAGERYLFISLIVIGLIFGGVITLLLEKSVLSRLAHLNADVSRIGVSREISGRVAVKGRDELSNLSGAINRMLDALEHSQTALQESESKYRTLVDDSQDGVFIIQDAKIEFANVAFARIAGYTINEVLGKDFSEFVAPEDVEMVMDRYYRRVAGEDVPREYEFHVLHKDGKSRAFVNMNAGVITYRRRVASMGTLKDITGRKRAEEMRMENERLVLANKTKNEFLAVMSHELRTPLNAIIGFSELLKKKDAGDLNEKQQRYADNVYSSGKHLLSLIDDILDITTIESGKMEVIIKKTSVPKAINESVEIIKEKAAMQNITIKKQTGYDIEFIETDENMFRQVLNNLLGNAVKFSKPEGGTVTITAEKEGDMAKFSVFDTGIGIKEEDMGRLFQSFEQLETGIARKYVGTGLGLAVSKKLVEILGGRITAESVYDVGSKFTFYLPVAAKKEGEGI